MTQPNLAAVPSCGELEPRECVDRHHVRLDAAHVAHGGSGAAALEQRADTRVKPGQVGARDRPPDRKRDRLRRTGSHQQIDRPDGQNSSVLRPMSSGAKPGLSLRAR
jgi:hypothetical protein